MGCVIVMVQLLLINSPKRNVFRHNIREKQRNMFFHALCLFLLLPLNLVEELSAKTITPPNLTFCMKTDILCRQFPRIFLNVNNVVCQLTTKVALHVSI